MNIRNIELGKFYRHRESPDYAWAKVIEILPPKTRENTTSKVLVKCEWVVQKTDTTGLIKYFKASDLK